VKRVLIADDNRDFAQVLKLALEAHGYAVSVATNGREAIAMQRTAAVDVLITDLVMPESDGFEAIDAFRKEFPATRLVIVSGAQRLDAGRYLAAAKLIGAHATFRKPFAVDDLLRTLREI
jgi:CheY-like chemotaxis protein